MKISWGTAIILSITSFICFIMFFVITMLTDEAYSHDLVTEEYYKTELSFQEQLDKASNAEKLTHNIHITEGPDGLTIHFPKEMDPAKLKGKVFLYRPSNKQLDSEIPLSLTSHQLLVPDNRLVGGRWNIYIDWSYDQQEYYYEEELTY